MALHNYRCPDCGFILRDVNVPIAIGATRGAPWCQRCRIDGRYMQWIPQIGRMDAGSVKTAAFEAFDTFDTHGKPVRVDNFRALRRIESDSEVAYRNNEGQLLRWRDASMDKSNRDVHSIARQPDRPMDMQDQPRVEATPQSVHRGADAERLANATPDHTPFSLEDAMPQTE